MAEEEEVIQLSEKGVDQSSSQAKTSDESGEESGSDSYSDDEEQSSEGSTSDDDDDEGDNNDEDDSDDEDDDDSDKGQDSSGTLSDSVSEQESEVGVVCIVSNNLLSLYCGLISTLVTESTKVLDFKFQPSRIRILSFWIPDFDLLDSRF